MCFNRGNVEMAVILYGLCDSIDPAIDSVDCPIGSSCSMQQIELTESMEQYGIYVSC